MPDNGSFKGTFLGCNRGMFTGLSAGSDRGLFSSGSIATELYEPETIAWVRQLSSPRPTPIYLYAVDSLIFSLKAASIWPRLDRLWIFAAEQQSHARVSLVNPTGINSSWPTNISEVNSPSWTAKQGYTGNGSSSYLNSNWIPSSAGVNYKLNNAVMGIYSRTNRLAFAETEIGAQAATGNEQSALNCSYNSVTYGTNNTSSYASVAQTDTRGLFSAVRFNAVSQQVTKNGAIICRVASNSNTVTPVTLYIGSFNANGTTINYSQKQLSMAYAGAGTIDQTILYNILQQFARRIKFNV